MRITNLGNDIPYKLSNIVYHFDKFLNTYKNFGVNDESLYYYNVHLKKHGLEDLIINIGPMTLLSSVLYEIFEQGQWLEISESMDYKPSERNMLNQFFESFKNEWKNNTPDYQEFFSELLQENLDDLVITEDDGTAVSQKALQLINAQQQVSDNRNVDPGTKLENDNFRAMSNYHGVMLDTTDNAGEFIYNIIKNLNDSADELGYTPEERFHLIRWGITGIVEDRLFTPSSDETDEMYNDTPNYNISKQEFLDIFKSWVNHLDNIGLDFDVVDLVGEIYGIDYEEEKSDFKIENLNVTNEKIVSKGTKVSTFIHGDFDFTLSNDDMSYNGTFKCFIDQSVEIEEIYDEDGMTVDKYDEYLEDIQKEIAENVDFDLFNEDDEDFTITNFSLNNQELDDEDNNYIVGTFSCDIGGEGENAEFRAYEEFSKDKKVLFVEINGLNEKNQIEYDKFDDFSVELDELIKRFINTDLWPQDVDDRDFKITNFQILNKTLTDNQIEGSFSCNIDDDYQIAQFTYQNETSEQDEIIQIFDLDEEIDTEFEKGGEFTNQLENFLRDNIDMDLFNVDEEYSDEDIEEWITNTINNDYQLVEGENYTGFLNTGGDIVDEPYRSYCVDIWNAKDDWDSWCREHCNLTIINSISHQEIIFERVTENDTDPSEDEYKRNEINRFLEQLSSDTINVNYYYPYENNYTDLIIESHDLQTLFEEFLNDEDLNNSIEVMPFRTFDGMSGFDKETFFNSMRNNLASKTGFEDYQSYLSFEVDGLKFLVKIIFNSDILDLLDSNLYEDQTDEDDIENARPVEDNQTEIESVIEGLNNTNFPSPRIEFYYPHLNIETAEIVPKYKVVELLNLLLNDDDYIGENYIVDDYVLKSIATDYMSFNELLSKLMEILPETYFENNEDTLYMIIPNNNGNFKIKLSVGAVLWNYFNDNFKR